jgi:hypothetical protein
MTELTEVAVWGSRRWVVEVRIMNESVSVLILAVAVASAWGKTKCYSGGMARAPIYVRQLTHVERTTPTAGLRSHDAFVPRRCQILLPSVNGKRA